MGDPSTFYQLATIPTGGGYGADRPTGAHRGVDFAQPEGTPIPAVQSGTVYTKGQDNSQYGLGNYVVIQSQAGYWLYGHLQNPASVNPGESVGYGQIIGDVGHTGYTEPAGIQGAHLHLALYNDGTLSDSALLNPGNYIGGAIQSAAGSAGLSNLFANGTSSPDGTVVANAIANSLNNIGGFIGGETATQGQTQSNNPYRVTTPKINTPFGNINPVAGQNLNPVAGPLQSATGTLQTLAGVPQDVFDSTAKLLQWVTNPASWWRLLFLAGGVALIGMGVTIYFHDETVPLAKTAIKAGAEAG